MQETKEAWNNWSRVSHAEQTVGGARRLGVRVKAKAVMGSGASAGVSFTFPGGEKISEIVMMALHLMPAFLARHPRVGGVT